MRRPLISTGSDSFTYVANDGVVDSNVATVTITVDPVNDAPVAVDDAYSTDEDTLLEVAVPGVLGNDVDPDLDPLIGGSRCLTSQWVVDFEPGWVVQLCACP